MPIPTISIVQTVTAPGRPARQETIEVEAPNLTQSVKVVPAAIPGVLTTRTDDNTGVVTVDAGHGVLDTDTVSVFWPGGARYNVDVTAVAATTISIDLGSGDNLPDEDDEVTVCIQVTEPMEIADGSTIVGIVAYGPAQSIFQIQEADNTPIMTIIKDEAGVYYWFDDSGENNPTMVDNPFGGVGVDVGKVIFSHGSVNEQELEISAIRE